MKNVGRNVTVEVCIACNRRPKMVYGLMFSRILWRELVLSTRSVAFI